MEKSSKNPGSWNKILPGWGKFTGDFPLSMDIAPLLTLPFRCAFFY